MTPGEKMIWAAAYADGAGFLDPMRKAGYATEVVSQARFALSMATQIEGEKHESYVSFLQEMLGEGQGDSVLVSQYIRLLQRLAHAVDLPGSPTCEECVDRAIELIQGENVKGPNP